MAKELSLKVKKVDVDSVVFELNGMVFDMPIEELFAPPSDEMSGLLYNLKVNIALSGVAKDDHTGIKDILESRKYKAIN